MKRRDLPGLPAETRAEIARRRLEQLAQSLAGPATGSGASVGGRHREAAPDELDDLDELDDELDDELADEDAAPRREPRRLSPHDVMGRSRLTPTHLRMAAAGTVAAGILLTWWLLAERPRTADVGDAVTLSAQTHDEPGATAPRASAPTPAEPQEVVVDVAGKVRRPGIVTLPAGSRVHEALKKAGGLKGRVDTSSLNLARVLVDGEQVLVGVPPATTAGSSVPGGGAGGSPAGTPVSLNAATLEQLDSLPGVGPVTAQRILDWRTQHGGFSTVDDLLDVPGIGDKTLADLRDLVTV